MKKSILEMLVREGYIRRFSVIRSDGQLFLRVHLRYKEEKKPVITGLKRVSKPGLRVYSNVKEMPRVIRGLGIAIVSTSKGILTDRQARKMNVGGEVLAYVW
jgi:small subunit ribosomal protein S8